MRILLALILLPGPAWADDFQSPSGNIHCTVHADAARCDLVDARGDHARPADCDLDWGRAYGVGPQGRAEALCAGDTVQNPLAPVLDYGRSTRNAGFTCISNRAGVTCMNAQGHGFSVSRTAQSLF